MRALVPLIALLAAAPVLPAFAQYNPPAPSYGQQSQYNPPNNNAAPNGSYRRSCSNIRVEERGQQRSTLTADCRDTANRVRTTTLTYRLCRGDIGNTNGVLSCVGATATNGRPDDNPGRGNGRGGGRNADGLPDGTWRQTCTERRMDKQWVKGQCLTNAGRRVLAEANTDRCDSFSYTNVNGRLECDDLGRGNGRGNGRGYGALPAGDWAETCRDADVSNGYTLQARCRTQRGDYRSSTLDVRTCQGSGVTNDNGILRCRRY